MKFLCLFFILFFIFSCKETPENRLTAKQIIDKAIEVSGDDLYEKSTIEFNFRDKSYVSENSGSILKRIFESESRQYTDVKNKNSFKRYIDNLQIEITDSLATVYSNSVNSVHYFAQLPYHLNDAAVVSKLLDEDQIKGKNYYVVQVTFEKANGGDDYSDTYLYWINKQTFKPDYLAYDFHTDGGGVRFRAAYNERYINGIRFVDYKNYKPKNNKVPLSKVVALFKTDQLEFLSDIQLENIKVTLVD